MYLISRLLIACILFAMSGTPTVVAAELVMLEQDGCVWCDRWHAEIGPIYAKTEEGKRAPLRLVDINEPIPEDLKDIDIERFTPTFVIVEDSVELGRIRGYPGDEFFWFLLKEALDEAEVTRN